MQRTGQKIAVIGSTGSGKSVLAEQVAARLGLPYIPTDSLYWGDDWQRRPLPEVHRRIEEITAGPQWVIDGNFDDRRVVWMRADAIVWLDYSRRVTWSRLVGRNLRWLLSGAPTWSGNRMTLRVAVSGVRHGLRGYGAKRRLYPEWLASSGVLTFRFRKPAETAVWLTSLAP